MTHYNGQPKFLIWPGPGSCSEVNNRQTSRLADNTKANLYIPKIAIICYKEKS